MTCNFCGHEQPIGWDILTCERCGGELGSCTPDGEPVRPPREVNDAPMPPAEYSEALKQAIARPRAGEGSKNESQGASVDAKKERT